MGNSNMALAKLDLVFFFVCHLILINLLLLVNPADSKCQKSFQCGNLTLEFPFSNGKDPACGLVTVDDCDSHNPKILSGHGRFNYTLLNAMPPNKLVILDPWLQNQANSHNCNYLWNISLPQSPSISFTFSPNLTIFSCFNQSFSEPIEEHFQTYNHKKCEFSTVYYKTPLIGVPSAQELHVDPLGCLMYQLPIKSNQDKDEFFHLLSPEFTLEWSVSEDCYKCHHRGGQCISNSRNEFLCKEKGNISFKKIVLIGGVTLAALISTSITTIIFIRSKYTPLKFCGFQKAKQGAEKDIELFLKNNGNLAPIRYKYSEIKKMTKSFSENLGKGGYGSVYKGKLPDGRPVAVKILNESKGNGEEYMNEVASISRTSHINIVTLLGFCSEGGSKRALIYEFMPNGSLEKFIHSTASSSTQGVLGWEKMIDIALGIARGLEYLHQGCNTRILHFDIKPHNILLDKNLNPRISDFGLAKLCPNRSSIVSMLVARGTIGYIAPEVFCRNFGEVSHKSDVYSYGMMVLEIAGGKKNNDPMDMDRTSEIYFPQYIYKQLEMDDERGGNLGGIMNEDESKFVKRKLIIVGLWCIQTDPRDRPSMSKVVEMLEGNVESLQLPPKPYLSSPPRAAPQFSISESV